MESVSTKEVVMGVLIKLDVFGAVGIYGVGGQKATDSI